MSRTASSRVSRWLAICLIAVLGRSALAGKTTNHAPVLNRDKFVQLTPENWNSGAPQARWARSSTRSSISLCQPEG